MVIRRQCEVDRAGDAVTNNGVRKPITFYRRKYTSLPSLHLDPDLQNRFADIEPPILHKRHTDQPRGCKAVVVVGKPQPEPRRLLLNMPGVIVGQTCIQKQMQLGFAGDFSRRFFGEEL